MPTPPRTARYMKRFQCLADRCEDTCCSGLRIPVTATDVERLRTVLEGPQVPADGFLPRDESGTCRFLAPSRLCGLQTRYGPGVLPAVCTDFPRVQVDSGGPEEEQVGSLACPEVVRELLAHGTEGESAPSFSLEPFDSSDVVARTRAGRQALRKLFQSGHSLAADLFVSAHLCAGLERGGVEAAALADIVTSPATQRPLPPCNDVPRETAAALTRLALKWLLENAPRFRATALGQRAAAEPALLETASLQDRYLEASALLDADTCRTRDRVLRTYALHTLSRVEPTMTASSLSSEVLGLSACLAVLRMFWVLHPTHDAVEVLQPFSKHVARAPWFLGAVHPSPRTAEAVLARSWLFSTAQLSAEAWASSSP